MTDENESFKYTRNGTLGTYDLLDALYHNPLLIRAGADICKEAAETIKAKDARITELEAMLAKANADLGQARSDIMKLSYAGDQFAAYMHPINDEVKPHYLKEYRRWRKLVNDVTARTQPAPPSQKYRATQMEIPMSDHPFKEFHEDCAIGNLMWRISRRRGLRSDSQDGVEINELRIKITADKHELDKLLAEYKNAKEIQGQPPE